MVSIRISGKSGNKAVVHAHFISLNIKKWPAAVRALDSALGTHIADQVKKKKLAEKSVTLIPTLGRVKDVEYVAMMGIGKAVSAEDLRWIGARLRSAMEAARADTAVVSLDGLFVSPDKHAGLDAPVSCRAFSDGFLMAGYSFDSLKSKPKKDAPRGPFVKSLMFTDMPPASVKACRDTVKQSETVIAAQAFARDLQNLPPNILYPAEFAGKVAAAAEPVAGLSVRIFDEKALRKMKAGAFLAVGMGSAHRPRMVVMDYSPSPVIQSRPPVVLVGKGLCFDSGGISIKPGSGMEEMKFDMSGAAAVAGAVIAAAKLKLKIHLIGVLGLAENIPSRESYRPGDIVTAMDSTSIEVINTDAEGRMVLADCLAYVKKTYQNARAVIDLATLTGACVVALGNAAAGLFSTDSALVDALTSAGETSGERLWPMPMFDEYDTALKSAVADVKHLGGKGAGAITAARFLKKFAPDHWAHLDIAGTSWVGGFGGSTDKPYLKSGLGTGFGVRVLIDYLRGL